MTERHEIDEYVRRLVPAGDQTVAGGVVRARLRERIADPDGPVGTVLGMGSWRVRLALVAAVAGVLVAGGAAVAIATGLPSRPDAVPLPVAENPRSGPVPPVDIDSALLCALYDIGETAIAFDGTIMEIGAHAEFDPTEIDPFAPVTFQVHEWFRGGATDQITVWMPAPESRLSPTPGPDGSYVVDSFSIDYHVGNRLLIALGNRREPVSERSGRPIVHYCEIIWSHTPELAGRWREELTTG